MFIHVERVCSSASSQINKLLPAPQAPSKPTLTPAAPAEVKVWQFWLSRRDHMRIDIGTAWHSSIGIYQEIQDNHAWWYSLMVDSLIYIYTYTWLDLDVQSQACQGCKGTTPQLTLSLNSLCCHDAPTINVPCSDWDAMVLVLASNHQHPKPSLGI